MPVAELIESVESVQYLTTPAGQRNAVVVNLEIWERLIQYLKGISHEESDEERLDHAMRREEKAYWLLYPKLREKYLGKYVAIHQEELVDHDEDQLELYLRIREKYGKEFVMITPVNEKAQEEVYTFRSPRLIEPLNNVIEKVLPVNDPERSGT